MSLSLSRSLCLCCSMLDELRTMHTEGDMMWRMVLGVQTVTSLLVEKKNVTRNDPFHSVVCAPASTTYSNLSGCSFRLCHFDFRTLAFLIFLSLSHFSSSMLSHVFPSFSLPFRVCNIFRPFFSSIFARWINFLMICGRAICTNWHIDDDVLNEINWPKHFLLLHFEHLFAFAFKWSSQFFFQPGMNLFIQINTRHFGKSRRREREGKRWL